MVVLLRFGIFGMAKAKFGQIKVDRLSSFQEFLGFVKGSRRLKQARKLQDAQAEKLTNLQANKLTS